MKRCGTCNQTYTDDLMFCLSDGTPLIGLLEEVEQQTVVRSAPAIATVKSVDGSGSMFKYLAAGLAVLLVLALIGTFAAVWILWPQGDKKDSVIPVPTPVRTSSPPDTLNTNQTDLKEKEEELERERRKITDERKKLEGDKRQKTETVEPEPPRFNDPGTARISFRRGSAGETVSGTVGRSRDYVLRTMAGQYLTASIRSSGGCVTFGGRSSTTSFTTSGGDTRLTVQNNCDRPTAFSMSVTVR